MWTVVYMAQSSEMAQKLKEILEEGGLIVKVRLLDRSSGTQSECAEVLVPETEVEEAHKIIIEKGF